MKAQKGGIGLRCG